VDRWNKEMTSLRDDLSRWLVPSAFNERLDRTHELLPSHILFNLPAARTVMDAWVLGRFGALTEADAVRLVADTWPDGQARFGARAINIEVTEVLEPGRRRGREYRTSPGIEMDPVENWIRRADAIGPLFERR
jgi:hypothetical protein